MTDLALYKLGHDRVVRFLNRFGLGIYEVDAENRKLTVLPGAELDVTDATITGLEAVVQQAIVDLTDTQIKAYSDGATYVPIVAAPGDGYAVRFLGATLISKFAGGAYGGIDTSDADASFFIGTNSRVSTLLADGTYSGDPKTYFSDVFGVAADKITTVMPRQAFEPDAHIFSYFYTLSAIENQPLGLSIYNGSGDLTNGHANNTLRIVTLYSVVAVDYGNDKGGG